MAEAIALKEQEQETTEKPRRSRLTRGRPPKSETDPLAMPRLATDVTGPRHKTYNSDSVNKNQRTSVAWTWWNALPLASKEILDLTVYRDWPRTLDPTEDSDAKSIEKILGTEPIQTDQDFVDRFGAGDYRAYLNVNPKGEARRTLFVAYVKCTHEFRDFPPTDRRIDNVANVDLNDKTNGSYVAWLRATGKLKDEQRDAKEKEEMATATQGLTEVLGKALDRGDRLMEKLIEERTESDIPSDPPPSPEEKLNESLSLLEKLQNFTNGKPTSDPLAMMNAVIEAAKVMSQANGQQSIAPFMDRIAALEEKLRATESEMLRTQLTEIKEQLRAMKDAPQSNITLADGTSVESIINKVVDRLADKPEDNPWLDIVKHALPSVLPLLGGIAQRLLSPTPQVPFPMPPASFQAGAPQPQQAQLPAPAPAQPMPQTQPQASGVFTTGNAQLDALLMAVVIPLADCLRDGETGAIFAQDFIESQGIETHTMLSQAGVEPIANIIASYPPLTGVMKKVPRDKLLQFVKEFCEYKEPPPEGASA